MRDHNEGQEVTRLEYEAFQELAVKEGDRIIAEALQRFPIKHALCIHRVGSLDLGDMAVWVGVSSAHRGEAFDACRFIIDEVKHRVPDLEEGALSQRRFRLGQLRALRGGAAALAPDARAPRRLHPK